VVFACAAMALTAAPARAQVSLGKAKELYASANYDEALTMLNALGSTSVSEDGPAAAHYSEDSASIAMYRVLCLVAVGRSADVDAAIDRLVSQHPLFRPPSDELSPRLRTAVSTARLRLLPPMVQRRYEESKTAYDRDDFSAASVGFKWVLTALTDPDISTLTGQSPFADIKTLAAGFIGLAEKALAPPPPVSPPAAIVAAPPAKPARDFKRVFSTDDTDVVAPVTTRQTMPQFPGVLKTAATGALEVVIDAAGAVESVRLMQSVHPRYDDLLLVAAKKWQYQPAQLEGTAVRYTKRIQISLAPPPTEASRR
jgi:TonB family protein